MGAIYLFPNEGRFILHADAFRIQQVVTNLVSNAIKYLPDNNGKIQIGIHDCQDEHCIEVHDNGSGIKEIDLERIFDRFIQIEKQAGPGEHGTDFGLAITRKLIELHGGRIWVETP